MRLSAYDKWLIEGDEKDEYIVARDWRGQEIWNYDGELYYNTELGYVREDEIKDYMNEVFIAQTIDEWEDC